MTATETSKDIYIASLQGVTIINPMSLGYIVEPSSLYKEPYSEWWTEKRSQLIEKAKKKIILKNKIIINTITFLAFICAIILAFLFAYFLGQSSVIFGGAMGLGLFALRMNLEMKYETNIIFIHLVRRGKNYW